MVWHKLVYYSILDTHIRASLTFTYLVRYPAVFTFGQSCSAKHQPILDWLIYICEVHTFFSYPVPASRALVPASILLIRSKLRRGNRVCYNINNLVTEALCCGFNLSIMCSLKTLRTNYNPTATVILSSWS